MKMDKRSVTILLTILAISMVWSAIPSIQAYPYRWYRSGYYYNYRYNYFPYRYIFYNAPYYYYVQDPNGNLASQVQTLQSQLQASQSQRDQAMAQAQQLSAQIESLNQQINDLKTQMNNANSQYASQLSNLQSQASNLQNSNQALQANLDATRTQYNIMLVIVALLGICVVALVLNRSGMRHYQPTGAQGTYSSNISFCGQCRTPLKPNSQFCPRCGRSVL